LKKEVWKGTTTCFLNPYTISGKCYIIHT